jgi:hypothetical protein
LFFQFRDKDFKSIDSTDWLHRYLHVADSSRAEDITSKHCIGRIQYTTIDPDLIIILHSEPQLEFMHRMPRGRRLSPMDCSGKFVYVPKNLKKYPAIMNYMILMPDSMTIHLEKPTKLIVNETISSRQDTWFIGHMLSVRKT